MLEIMKAVKKYRNASDFMEGMVVLSLIILAGTMFFSERSASVFDSIPIAVILVWRFISTREPQRMLPQSLIIITLLYLLSYFIGALMSANQQGELNEFGRRYTGLLHPCAKFCKLIWRRDASTLRSRKILPCWWDAGSGHEWSLRLR